MDEGPKLHHIIVSVTWGGFMGLILGTISAWGAANHKQLIVVGCIVSGCFIGFVIVRWFFGRQEDFVWYQSGAYALPEARPAFSNGDMVILSLHIHADDGQEVSKEIRGLTRDEWKQLGRGVQKYKGFSSRILQTIFGASRGSTIYELTKNILNDERVKILVPAGNGYSVTGRGWSFFEHLENEQYEILGMLDSSLPSPTSETV